MHKQTQPFQLRYQRGTDEHRSSDGPVGSPRGRSTVELQIRREEETMAIGTTDDETADRGGDDVTNAQGRGGQDTATKIGASILDITGNMAVERLEGRTSGGKEGECKAGTEDSAIIRVRSAGRQMATGASGRCKH